jgi:hypothetical protein
MLSLFYIRQSFGKSFFLGEVFGLKGKAAKGQGSRDCYGEHSSDIECSLRNDILNN